MIESLTMVGKNYHAIYKAMHHQKSNKKKTGKTHYIFFSERRTKEEFPCHKKRIDKIWASKNTTGSSINIRFEK